MIYNSICFFKLSDNESVILNLIQEVFGKCPGSVAEVFDSSSTRLRQSFDREAILSKRSRITVKD